MKKHIFFTLCCAISLSLSSQAQNDSIVKSSNLIQMENTVRLRQDINRPVTVLRVKGNSYVELYYDSINFVIANQTSNETGKHIKIKGTELTVDNNNGTTTYQIHLNPKDITAIYCDNNATIKGHDAQITIEGTTDDEEISMKLELTKAQKELRDAKKELNEAKKELNGARKELNEAKKELNEGLSELGLGQSNSGRMSLRTSWGFTNWGDKWNTGLSGLDGAYKLKTSFSAYQIELRYAMARTRHFNLRMGLSYESNIFKFKNPIIDIDGNGNLMTANIITTSYNNFLSDDHFATENNLNSWNTKMVTRYLGLPISLDFNFGNFNIGLTAIPAIALTGRHTGLKQQIDGNNNQWYGRKDISDYINRYKLDVRMDVNFKGVGLFAKVSTLPLFDNDNSPVYPLTFGFTLGF